MILGVTLENVKVAKGKTHIDILPTTVLIGENGTGKSTFLQMLAMLKQNYGQNDMRDGDFVHLGGYRGLANDATKPVRITVNGEIEPDVGEPFTYLKKLDYSIELEYKHDHLSSIRLRLLGKNLNEMLKARLGISSDLLLDLKRNFNEQPSSDNNSFFYDPNAGKKIAPVAISVANNPRFELDLWIVDTKDITRDVIRSIQATLSAISIALKAEFTEKISYVPALRGIDTSQYRLLEQDHKDFVDSRNFNHQAMLLLSSIAMNRENENRISAVLEQILNRKFQFRILPNNNVAGETHNGKKWVNVINEGFGSNPLIHLIAQLVIAPSNSLVLVEEPEVHLYPKALKRLMSVLLEISKAENKHLLITTHSEHVIVPFMKRISGGGDTSDFKVYITETDADNGTRIAEVTAKNVQGVLKDFLSVSLGDIAAILEMSGIEKKTE